jgi:hypothetical protein
MTSKARITVNEWGDRYVHHQRECLGSSATAFNETFLPAVWLYVFSCAYESAI